MKFSSKQAEQDPSTPESNAPSSEEGLNLRNYLLMVYERKWYALPVFLTAVFIAVAYNFLATAMYEGVATVQVLKHGPQVLRVADVVESSITSDTDFNTQIKILESVTMIKNVAARLTPEELKQLTDPYKKGSGAARSPVDIIYAERRIQPQRLTFIVAIRFLHPDPKMAARIANLIAAEYISYNTRLRIEESMKAVDELKDRAEQQRKRVDEIANALQAYRQRGNLISLVQTKDIVTEKLKQLNQMATQTAARLKEAEVRWNQVREWTKSSRDLSELTFIAAQPKVGQLIAQITTQRLNLESMRDRYKDKHPKWIESANSLAKAEAELKGALEMASMSIKAEYENAVQNEEAARKALSEQETRSLDLDKSAVEYENLTREFRVNDQLLESMMARMRETSVTSSIETESARIIDHAVEPGAAVFPKKPANLAIGVVAGIFLGSVFAYLIAMLDDRIKTAFDVETMLGLPLIGVISRVSRLEGPDKAQIVANGADRSVIEAFLSAYSTIRLSEESRTAKLILVTSTLPREGKSFVSTNLALTFASQGQRTVLVDCDLRRPNIQASLRLRSTKGVTGYCSQNASLEEIVTRNVHPNLDVIPSGMRAKNPIQLLNSREFETLVSELGKRYDRVIFDTPPLGAVSDAVNIIPLMDGVVYTIRFNAVKRRVAQRCVKTLFATNIPVLGAILNDTDSGITGGYYVDNNTKVFRDYYDVEADSPADASAPKRRFVRSEEPAEPSVSS